MHNDMHNEITLTPRISIGTVEYWNGTHEIDAWEYEILRHTGCKITLWAHLDSLLDNWPIRNSATVCICENGQHCELCDIETQIKDAN